MSIVVVLMVVGLGGLFYYLTTNDGEQSISQSGKTEVKATTAGDEITSINQTPNKQSDRLVTTSDTISLPLGGSAPTEQVQHSIPIEDIRRGCFRQDCIPSVDNPEFISVEKADQVLPDDTIGIALSKNGINRFYPFNMLVTREIVNDVVDGEPVLVTYCPLCGTGVVFERVVDGEVYEFGVSGMLWQSNLLMYNRAGELAKRNLWSQVLGEAVVGAKTGTKLTIIPSDIQQYTTWREAFPGGEVLNTGRIGDPYGGDYYRVARSFAPDFDEDTSALNPTTYVYGIEHQGEYIAFEAAKIPEGETIYESNGSTVTISRTGETVTFTNEQGEIIADVEGFWFSWQAAHPDTMIWQP